MPFLLYCKHVRHIEGERDRERECFQYTIVRFMIIGLHSRRLGITSESRGDVTCGSLGDVTWSHGTHDVKRSVGKVRRIWMRKQHQEGQIRIVVSTRGFLLLLFRINRNRSSNRSSSTQASHMSRACILEGARWCQLAVTSIVCIAEGRQRQRPQTVSS